MPAQLVALHDGRTITLDKGIVVVGRHEECDIQILSPKISRMHCCIAQVGHYLVVRDLQSTNGIRVNGVRVMEGRLGAGDELTIGNQRYQVRGDVAPLKPVPAPPAEMPAAPKRARAPVVADLESCDEPVALPEPGSARAKKAQILPPAKESAPLHHEDPNGRTEASSDDDHEIPIVLPSEDPLPPPVPPYEPELIAPEEETSNRESHPSH